MEYVLDLNGEMPTPESADEVLQWIELMAQIYMSAGHSRQEAEKHAVLAAGMLGYIATIGEVVR